MLKREGSRSTVSGESRRLSICAMAARVFVTLTSRLPEVRGQFVPWDTLSLHQIESFLRFRSGVARLSSGEFVNKDVSNCC